MMVWQGVFAIMLMALIPLGIYVMMDEGMILHGLRTLLAKYIPEPLGHAFYSCPRCMVSVWGIIPAFLITGCNPWLLIPYAVAAVGLQEVMHR